MPLHDHFRPPLSDIAQWGSFHYRWAVALADDLGERLPPGHFAEPCIRFHIEVDVGLMERLKDEARVAGGPVWDPDWTPGPAAARVAVAVDTDEVEARVYDTGRGEHRLVAAIELVSPANKDDPAGREAFLTKCARHLQQGVGVVIVDVVTSYRANLHGELMARLGHPDAAPLDAGVYATSYRVVGGNGAGQLDAWVYPLALGQPLPTVPLWMLGGAAVPARLGETYDEVFRRSKLAQRLPAADAA